MAMVEPVATSSLRAREKAIADSFTGGVDWVMVAWPLVNTTVWLALWPLVITGTLPLWAGFIIAIVNCGAAYLPSHDAQHHIYAPEGSRWHWLNEAIGWYSVIPMFAPLSALRSTHYEHHRHTNDPLLDPDYNMASSSAWGALANAMVKGQPRHDLYGPALIRLDTPAARQALMHVLISKVVRSALLVILAWTGFVWEAVFLAWLPLWISQIYVNFYLSWAPHQPMTGRGRYRDTHAFKSIWGNIGSSGMQYHIVHHLYPTIPLSRNPAAFRALRPILAERGCDLGGM